MSSDVYRRLYARDDFGDEPVNADVDGFAVGIANVVINVCLRILITWSQEDLDEGIRASLIQVLPVLLSTLFSVNRGQLSIFDVYYELVLTSSPLTLYVIAASICQLFKIKTGLYKRVKSHRLFTSILGALILPLWLAISITGALSNRAFIGSEENTGGTFGDWLRVLLFSVLFDVLEPGLAGPISLSWFGFPLLFILLRRRHNVIADIRHRLMGKPKAWQLISLLWVPINCAWCTIDRHHKWYIYFVFLYLDACWAATVVFGAVYIPPGNGYVLSFGQVLAIFTAIPPILSTVQLIYSRRLDLSHFFRHLPKSIKVEVVYLATGKQLDKCNSSPGLATHLSLPLSTSREDPPGPRPGEPLQLGGSSTDIPMVELSAVCEQPRDIAASGSNIFTAPTDSTSRRANVPTASRSQTHP